MEIRRKALGEHDPNYAQSMINLALLYESIGEYPNRAKCIPFAKAFCKRPESLRASLL